MNIARLLRFNVCLICVLGYFLLKVNEKKMSFETDGLVLENVSHLEMVKGQGGQRTLVFCLKSKTCFLGTERLSICKLLNLLVQY